MGAKSVTIAAPSKPKPSTSHHHERGHGHDDHQQADAKFQIPPEIAAAMDPQELAMQIQMMEEYARQQRKREERDSRKEPVMKVPANSSAGGKNGSSKKRHREEEVPSGQKPSGFVHGFDRFEQQQEAAPNKSAKSDKKKAEAVSKPDDFFLGAAAGSQ